MPNNGKFLDNQSGRTVQISAIATSAGATDAGKIPKLGSDGRWDVTFMPVGFGADTDTIIASEALSAGAQINIWSNAGVRSVRNADATASGKEADGFVLSAVSSGANATVYFEGTNTGVSGLTIGARYYTSTTPGAVTSTPPSGSGNVVQYVGRAASATALSFEPEDGVILA